MNNKTPIDIDAQRAYLLLNEIAETETLSQRDLSRRLGFAVGLVNTYLKHLVAKGFVRVKAFPKNRYGYLLTPKGIREKSRLACEHLSYFNGLFTTVRREFQELFHRLRDEGVSSVVFCGVDEVAEIAYLALREAGLELEAVVDADPKEGQQFLGIPIHEFSELPRLNVPVVVTSLKRHEQLEDLLHLVLTDGKCIVNLFRW